MEETTNPQFDEISNYKNQLLENFNKSIGISEAPLRDPSQYNPRPSAIDIAQNITGNPEKGSNPGIKNFDFSNQGKYVDSVSDYLTRTAAQNYKSDYQIMKPYSYNGDYDGAKFERYYNSKPFKQLGFSPYRDNESLYNEKMTFGDQFVRAAGQWPSLFWTGFKSSATAWKNMFTDPLTPDLKGAEGMERAMAYGSSTEEGLGNWFTNQFLNSAYTVGVGANMLAETLLLKGMTKGALAFGEKAGLTEATRIADETIGGTKNLENLDYLRSFWNQNRVGKAMAAVGRTINPFEGTWEVGKQLVRGENSIGHLSDYARYVDNFGQFAKDAIQIKAAVSEASLEGGMSQMNITRELVDNYRKKNGKDPDGDELAKIESIAKDKAREVAFWNLPAIMWSNKFMYETMFRPFEKKGVKLIDDLVFNAEKKEFETLVKPSSSLLKPKTYLNFGRKYLKANLAEGVQENIQEAISSGAASHAQAIYESPERAAYETYMGHFLHGAREQFSPKGFETFAGGFLMGAMASPVMSVGPKTFEAIGNRTWNKEAHEARENAKAERTQEVVNTLNELYKSPLQYFAPELSNVVKQTKLNQDLFSAQEEYNKKKGKDIQDLSVFEHIYTAFETGHMDTVMNKFKNYQKFTPEEAAEAFYGTKDAELGKRALSQIDNIIDRAETIKQDLEDVNGSYPNKFDPNRFIPGTPEYEAASISYKAWEEGKKNLVFAKNTFREHNKRILQVEQAFIGKSKPLMNASAQDLMVLLDPNALQTEARLLNEEIKVLDDSTPEGKKEKKRKETKLRLLNNVATNVFAESDVETLINMGLNEKLAQAFTGFLTDTTAKKSLIDYMQFLANDTKSFAFDDKLEDALKLIEDSLLLKNERYNLVQSINVLNNPKGFLNLQYRLTQTFKKLRDNQAKTIKDNIESTLKKIETNEAIQDLYKKHGIALTDSYALQLYNAIKEGVAPPYPTEFVDTTDNDKLINSGEKFEKALEDWKANLSAISKAVAEQVGQEKTEETKKPEEVKKETTETPEEEIITPQILSVNTPYNDLPEELQKALSPMYLQWVIAQSEILNKELDSNDPDLKNEFIKAKWDSILENPKLASIISKYQVVKPDETKELIITEAVVSKVKPNEKQQKALNAIDEINKKNVGRSEDQLSYSGGRKRVTQVVEDVLKTVYGIPPFQRFMSKRDTETQLVKDTYSTHTGNLDELITKLKSTRLRTLLSDKQFDKIKETLAAKNDMEEFTKIVNELSWASAAERGNVVDGIVRDFFEGIKVTKPVNITDEAFKALIDELKNIQKALEAQSMIAITAVRRPDGSRTGVITSNEEMAGEMDILIINKEGEFEIFDIKTANTSKWKDFHISDTSSKKRYSIQQSLYKRLLENETGIPVKRIALIPIETENDKDGKVTQVRRRTMGKLVYTNPGAGKSEFVELSNKQRNTQPQKVRNDYQEYVDADKLLIAEIRKRGMAKELGDFDYNQSTTDEAQYLKNFADWSAKQSTDNFGRSPRAYVYKSVEEEIKQLLKNGKSVLTGSIDYVKDADLVFMAPKGSKLSRESFDTVEEGATKSGRDRILETIKKEGKEIIPLEAPIERYLSVFKMRSMELEYDKAVDDLIKKAPEVSTEAKADIQKQKEAFSKLISGEYNVAYGLNPMGIPTDDEFVIMQGLSNKILTVKLTNSELEDFIETPEKSRIDFFKKIAENRLTALEDNLFDQLQNKYGSDFINISFFPEGETDVDNFLAYLEKANLTKDGKIRSIESAIDTYKRSNLPDKKESLEKLNAKLEALKGKPVEVITDDVYNNYVDKNEVPQDILESIADKVINKGSLSERETAIFTGKTSEINEIIRNKTAQPTEAQLLKSYNDLVKKIKGTDSLKVLEEDINNELVKFSTKLDNSKMILLYSVYKNQYDSLINNLNSKSLKYLQEKEIEVVYSNTEKPDISGNYIILKVTDKAAILASPTTTVEIPADDFKNIRILGETEEPTFSDEDVNTAKENFKNVQQTQKTVDTNPDVNDKSLDDLAKDLIDSTNDIKCD